ncbi:MAG: universal stress protein [Desulfovibrionales bacterium]|nr:MAG: universal stress protein [Desulfovibrionales bacterium]
MSFSTENLLEPMSESLHTIRKLLVCVSQDPGVLHGARFVSHFFQPSDDLHIDLALTPQSELPEDDPDQLSSPEAVHWAVSIFEEAGFSIKKTRTSVNGRPLLDIRDIAKLAQQRRYDAAVLGRHGIHRFEEHLHTVFKETEFDQYLDFPFWICRTPDLTRKDVLLCVDGSKPGLCAADHVGMICAPEQRHSICVAYLADPHHRDHRDELSILDNAVRMLRVNAIAESRISTKILVESDPVHGILQEAERGRYAVVAVGRAGTGRGMMADRQFGSISLRLSRELSGSSLWVCGYPCKL